MFKFNFAAAGQGQQQCPVAAPASEAAPQAEAQEVQLGEAAPPTPTTAPELVSVASNLTLIKGSVSSAEAAHLLGDSALQQADLVPGVYEGGFKVWEGALNLARYLAAELLGAGAGLEGRRVLELGCGHGLPGLVALRGGAEVHFQDYNRCVLTALTAPGVVANWQAWQLRQEMQSAAPGAAPPARFFVGSWQHLPALLKQEGLAGGYDLVLTAETIYSLDSTRSLYACMKQCLRRPGGVAYVAAKSYYFGVGGGTAAFRQLVQQEGGFEVEVVALLDDGLSNKREIIKLTAA